VNTRRLSPVLAITLLAALPVAGCGTSTLDVDQAEVEIQKGLKQQLKLKTVDVSCPEEVEIKAGSKFQCSVKGDNDTGTVEVTQKDDQGNIGWQLKQQ